LKIYLQKRAGGVAQGVGPEFKLQHSKNKKKEVVTCKNKIYHYVVIT
jgi:hypothetical protein